MVDVIMADKSNAELSPNMYTHVYIYIYIERERCIYIYMYTYVCIYIYIYIYTHMYTHTYSVLLLGAEGARRGGGHVAGAPLPLLHQAEP